MNRYGKLISAYTSKLEHALAKIAKLERFKHPPDIDFASLLDKKREPVMPKRIRRVCILKSVILYSFVALVMVAMQICHLSSDAAESNKVDFTKIQDLNLGTKPVNRPVRQKWALVIGLNNFLDHRLSTTQAYDKAASHFVDYLTSPKGGRFRADHVRVLLDEKATQQNISNSFGPSWFGRLVGPDDLVVVYIATRSFPTTDGNSYLCSYNCTLDNIYGTCLSIQSLMQTIRTNLKSDRIVLIVESAYSGAVDLGSAASKKIPGFNVELEKVIVGKGLMILSSSQSDQLSWQTIFSDNLTSSLSEKEGLIPLDEAFLKAKQKTEYDSVNRIYNGRKQTPVMKSDWSGNDLVLGCEPLDSTTGIPEESQQFLGAEAHYFNANKAVINSDLNKAIAEYQEAIKADPSLSDARADYAVVLSMQGKWTESEDELRKALAIRPDDALYLTNYARVLDKLGQKDESKKILEKAYSINPKDRVTLVALADKNLASGDKEAAMRLLDQALVLYSDNAVVQDRMAFLLSMQGRNDEALAHAKEAVKLDPSMESAHLKLGALYLLNGDGQSAVKEYQVVLAKNDANADAHFLLAQALEKSGDTQALAEYKKFLSLCSSSDKRRAQVEERLKTVGPN